MRYPDGGGLSPAARERRKTVRLQAARLFAEDVAPVEVATRLRVSTKSAYQWRRGWGAGGEAALASGGAGGAGWRPRRRRWRGRAGAGRAAGSATPSCTGCARSWSGDRPSTAGPISAGPWLFHLRYTPRGTAYLLHRIGWSPQVPRHRAAERDEDAIAAWRTLTWAKVRG